MARSSEKIFPEMVVTAFAWIGSMMMCDVIRISLRRSGIVRGRALSALATAGDSLVQREPDRRLEDSGPFEFRIEIWFLPVGIRSESVLARPAVECPLEVESPDVPRSSVILFGSFPDLPVSKAAFQRVSTQALRLRSEKGSAVVGIARGQACRRIPPSRTVKSIETLIC